MADKTGVDKTNSSRSLLITARQTADSITVQMILVSTKPVHRPDIWRYNLFLTTPGAVTRPRQKRRRIRYPRASQGLAAHCHVQVNPI